MRPQWTGMASCRRQQRHDIRYLLGDTMQLYTSLAAGAVILALQVPANSAQNQGGKQEQPQPFASAPAGFDAKHEGIEHGKMETVDYESKVSGGMRKMVVYTPPGYPKGSKYAVLYLLHGIG